MCACNNNWNSSNNCGGCGNNGRCGCSSSCNSCNRSCGCGNSDCGSRCGSTWNHCSGCGSNWNSGCGCGGNNNRIRQAFRRGYAEGYRVGYDEGFREGFRACNGSGILPLSADSANADDCGCNSCSGCN